MHRILVASLWLLSGASLAQDAAIDAATHEDESTPRVVTPARQADTVQIELLDDISSKTAKRGDRFRLRLTHPVAIDSNVHLQAGTEGYGEVVHADPARAGGKAGELILAARALVVDGHNSVPLRGLRLQARGKDTSGQALATAIVLAPISLVALFVRGGEIVILAGTHASAKLGAAGPSSEQSTHQASEQPRTETFSPATTPLH